MIFPPAASWVRVGEHGDEVNLRGFPRDQKSRFFVMVTKGKNNMPPWGDVLKPEDLEALWAYVVAGER
jgi:mono/diheme cytochrome c family protein